jgi:hypothetical protein
MKIRLAETIHVHAEVERNTRSAADNSNKGCSFAKCRGAFIILLVYIDAK